MPDPLHAVSRPMKKRTAQAMVAAGLAEENLGGGAPAGAADDMDDEDSDDADSDEDEDSGAAAAPKSTQSFGR